MELGEIIKTRRVALGLNQEELANLTGCMSQQTIAHLESGRNKSTKFLPELAEALEMTVEELRGKTSKAKLSVVEQAHKALRSSSVSIPKLTKAIIAVKEAEKDLKSTLSDDVFARVVVAKYMAPRGKVIDFIEIFKVS